MDDRFSWLGKYHGSKFHGNIQHFSNHGEFPEYIHDLGNLSHDIMDIMATWRVYVDMY